MSGAPKDDGLSRAEIYRRAAELILLDVEGFSCLAIRDAAAGVNDHITCSEVPECGLYEALFFPDTCEHNEDGPEWHYGEGWGREWADDAVACRVLALCFAAAMADAGDL